jgi:hypothetical protein
MQPSRQTPEHTVKLAELSDADQRLVRAGRAAIAKARGRRPAASDRGHNTWTCRCGLTFTAWAPAERHARDTDHRRLDLDISRHDPGGPCTT